VGVQFGDVIPISLPAVVIGQVNLMAGQDIDRAELAAVSGGAFELFPFRVNDQRRAMSGQQGIGQMQPVG
jgi:hypothetical protein